VAQLVRDGERQQLVQRHSKLRKQRPGSLLTGIEQSLFEEGLPFLENREGWAVLIPTNAAKNRRPVFRLDENPHPLPEPRQVHFTQDPPKPAQLDLAISLEIASVAAEMKLWRDGGERLAGFGDGKP